MKTPPLLSVIIPMFNAEKFIETAIKSIINQIYKNIEIVIIDDGSTDRSAEIVKSHKEIKYFFQPNQGPAAARNLGILNASASYLGFHDADDICEVNRFSEQMNLITSYKNIEIVYTRIQNFVEIGAEVPDYLKTETLMLPRMGFISSAIIKKSVFEKVGVFDTELLIGEDIDWIARADKKNICSCTIPDVLIQRRLHQNNLSKDIKLGHKLLSQILRNKIKS